MMLERFTVGGRLRWYASVMVGALVVIAGLAEVAAVAATKRSSQLAREARMAARAAEVRSALLTARRYEKDLFLSAPHAREAELYAGKFDLAIDELGVALAGLAEDATEPEDMRDLEVLREHLAPYTLAMDERKQDILAGRLLDPAAGNQLNLEYRNDIALAEGLSRKLVAHALERAREGEASQLEDSRRGVALFLVAPLLTAVLAYGLGRRVAASIINPFTVTMRALEELSAGNLDVEVPPMGRGEPGRTREALVHAISEMREDRATLALERTRAVEALRVKSEFLANVSHEIRTPLNGLLGLTRLVQESLKEPEHRASLQQALDSGQALLRLLNDILDISRIEAGRLELEPMAFDALELLEGVGQTFGGLAADKGLSLVLEHGEGLPHRFAGDALRVRQVLWNLVSNAIKFTCAGTVLVRAFKAEDGALGVTVIDEGIGIPADRLATIFEPFTQVDASVTRRFGGTGLGLAIARRLAEHMGGRLTATSEVGRGSTFLVTLPLACVVEPEASAPDRRLVLVDPNEATRGALARSLRAEKTSVWEFDSLEQLAELAASVPAGTPVAYDATLSIDELRKAGAHLGPHLALAPPGCTVEGPFVLRPVLPPALWRALAVSRPVMAQVAPAGARRLKVLVAEDNPVNVLVVRRVVEKEGHEVVVVGDGQAALDAIPGGQFDLVLMDVQMPVLDGISATRQLRELPEGKQLPVVALTASVMPADLERLREVGVSTVLPKPVDFAHLRQVLSSVGRQGAGGPQGLPASPLSAGLGS